MAAILYRSLTIARFWALLEAHSPFTTIVKAARRVEDTSEGWLKRMILRSPGDFPILQIEMGDNFAGGPIPVATFSDEPGGFGDASDDYWDEEATSDFKLSFIYEQPGFDKQDELEMEALTAIRAGGRNLGYSAVKKWGPYKARRNGSATVLINGEPTARPVTQIIIPVLYEFTGAQLKP